MNIFEIILIGVSLAMDAFAVSVCKGLSMKKINWVHAIIIGGFFGAFQAIMPLLGWLLGSGFSSYIDKLDHWIGFLLLMFIGAKMAFEAVKEMRETDDSCDIGCKKCNLTENPTEGIKFAELFILAIATSIDALAVGITFAFLEVNIISSSLIIGVITFVICLFGVAAGNRFGSRYKTKAELAGGIVLCLIGVKILLDGLGVISF
jgi:putative Mn2+ efflux pump MntP